MRSLLLTASFATSILFACDASDPEATASDDDTDVVVAPDVAGLDAGAGRDASADTVDVTETADTPEMPAPDPNTVSHSFGTYTLAPFEETSPCVIWTLNNEQPLYVNEVVLANDGGFHHSNWFVVPDYLYEGDDGFFDCGERNFTELRAALEGTVLFAQSTQSLVETQAFRPGAVIKVPPNHSIVTSAHLLNLSDRELETELRMQLRLIHPREVEAILSPIRFTYTDLAIPAGSEARFTGECALRQGEESIKVHWVLPHYHYLGNHFSLDVLGGPNDGDRIYELDGFNADANGQAYDPPVDLAGATGLRFTCGYFNPTSAQVGWGIGDQEMCVMLALVEADAMLEGLVNRTDETTEVDGMLLNSGDCAVAGLPPNANQWMPTEEELAGELYVPPSDGTVDGPIEGSCVDTPPDAEPAGPSTLSGINQAVFVSSCAFSSCHGGPLSSAGLDLSSSDLHAALLEHTVSRDGAPALVVPGDPEGSYLYQLLSQCEPNVAGASVPHMPLNAPELLAPGQVARIREWIEAGAADD